jgi:hypothetical protein
MQRRATWIGRQKPMPLAGVEDEMTGVETTGSPAGSLKIEGVWLVGRKAEIAGTLKGGKDGGVHSTFR